jgi:transposase
MFIRQKKSPLSTAIQIVKSTREGNKVRQDIIRHVGVIKNASHDYVRQIEKMMILADKIKNDLQNSDVKVIYDIDNIRYVRNSDQIAIGNIKIIKDIVNGIHDVFGSIYKIIGFDNLFRSKVKQRRNYSNHLFNTVMARIYNPVSKLKTSEILESDFAQDVSVDKIYKMMDQINDSKIDNIKKIGYNLAKKLLGGEAKIKILFYDVTTIYFESFIEDDLKQYGYSKDFKFNQSQIMLSIAVTEDGLPIDYNLYPGSTFEGHTLKEFIRTIKQKYHQQQVTVVADRGMFNKDNIDLLEKSDLSYIIATKLKTLKKDIKQQILDIDSYQEINDDLKIKEIFLADKQNKIIISYSVKRAKKDKADRDKSILKLQQKLKRSNNPKDLISNYGYQKYITINNRKEINFEINQRKIIESQKWDGLHGVITNNLTLTAIEAVSQYKGLWQIEDSFRLAKTNLKIRPVYHFVPPRIKAHIAISFMALICLRYAEYVVKTRSCKISPARIVRTLAKTTATIVQDQQSQKIFAIPQVSQLSEHLYKLFEVPYRNKAYYPH